MSPLRELEVQLNTGVSPKDVRRLKPHLTGWNHLNEILLLGQVTEADVRKLILIELLTKKRRTILMKLTARLKSMELVGLRNSVFACLNPQ